jgi:hypothetical protein
VDSATTGVLLRHDAAVGERIGLHQERWQVEATPSATTTASATASLALLLGGHLHTKRGRERHDQKRHQPSASHLSILLGKKFAPQS